MNSVFKLIYFLLSTFVLLVPSAHSFVALDELQHPETGKRIVIFGHVHEQAAVKLFEDNKIHVYEDEFINSLGSRDFRTNQRPLLLVELMETASPFASYKEGFFGKLHGWLERHRSVAIDVRRSDARTSVTYLNDIFQAALDFSTRAQTDVISRTNAIAIMNQLRLPPASDAFAILSSFSGKATVIRAYNDYQANLQHLKSMVPDIAAPTLVSDLENHLKSFVLFLEQSSLDKPANLYVSYLYDLRGEEKMTLGELKSSFIDVYHNKLDFLYADANWFYQTMKDQVFSETRVTALLLGDSHRKSLSTAFIEAGYRRVNKIRGGKVTHTPEGRSMALDYSELHTIGTYLARLPDYLRNAAAETSPGAFADFRERQPVEKCGNSTCKKPGSMRCGACKAVYYCGAACQRSDWKIHRAECLRLRTDTSSAHP